MPRINVRESVEAECLVLVLEGRDGRSEMSAERLSAGTLAKLVLKLGLRHKAVRDTTEDRTPWWMYPLRTLRAVWYDNVLGMAAMVAFFAFLSLIPLVILLLAFVGDVMQGVISPRDVQSLFHSVTPGLSQKQFLNTYWYPVQHSQVATRILGVASLLVGTTGLHDSLDWAVNRIWRSPRTRSFWVGKLRGLAIIIWVIIFSIFSLWLAWLWAVVLGAIHAPQLPGGTLFALVPSLILDVIIFSALYKLTPTVEVDGGVALLAGVVGASLWEASKIVFGWWVLGVSSYNRVYGPLAASVIVMLWLWVSAIIFLFGAELGAVLQDRHRHDQMLTGPRPRRQAGHPQE